MTTQEEIEIVHGNGTHVVILGAGATLASTKRNSEKNGKQLPLMHNIVEVVGLKDIVGKLPRDIQEHENEFEKLYSKLYDLKEFESERKELDKRIYDYFASLELPDEPTIYDYLILSLRHEKDIIATFNWDPLLYQAYLRNSQFINCPGILFLHGNVAIGYNKDDGSKGPVGYSSPISGGKWEPTELLYPVEKKDYNSSPFLKKQWDALHDRLEFAERVTVFGYSAPVTDVEAIDLLQKAWGSKDERDMEQLELINIGEKEKVKESWDSFIHSHHYNYYESFFDSSLARHPRRSVESYHHWAMPKSPSQAFQDGNPVPQDFKTLNEMWEWYKPLLDAEGEPYEWVVKPNSNSEESTEVKESVKQVKVNQEPKSKRRKQNKGKRRKKKRKRISKIQKLRRMTRRRTRRNLRKKGF